MCELEDDYILMWVLNLDWMGRYCALELYCLILFVCLFVGGIAVQYIFRSIWDVGRVIMIFLAYTHEY